MCRRNNGPAGMRPAAGAFIKRAAGKRNVITSTPGEEAVRRKRKRRQGGAHAGNCAEARSYGSQL